MMTFAGFKIVSSPLCKRRVPVRTHKHPRIQKKWIKRYGMKDEYVTFMVGGNTVCVHPDQLPIIKAAANKEFGGMK